MFCAPAREMRGRARGMPAAARQRPQPCSLVLQVVFERLRQRQGADVRQALAAQGQADGSPAQVHQRQGLGCKRGKQVRVSPVPSRTFSPPVLPPARCAPPTHPLCTTSPSVKRSNSSQVCGGMGGPDRCTVPCLGHRTPRELAKRRSLLRACWHRAPPRPDVPSSSIQTNSKDFPFHSLNDELVTRRL